MQSFRIVRKLSATLMLGGIVAAALAAPAQAREPGAYGPGRATSAACEQARLFAWFQRQLRLREGDTEPLQPAEPAQCGGALTQEGGAAVAQNVAQVERREDAPKVAPAATVAR